ncbi:MAG: UDP-N-acetylmuramate--L-alanine ligase [Acidimicrobiales bacterium]
MAEHAAGAPSRATAARAPATGAPAAAEPTAEHGSPEGGSSAAVPGATGVARRPPAVVSPVSGEGGPVPAPGRVDLDRPRRLHLVGIGGSGLSSMAEVLIGMGHRVSGSDVADSPVLDRLRGLGVAVTVGHDTGAAVGAEVVTVSTAIPADDPEVAAARAAGVAVVRRAALLAAITALRRTVAVSGTSGKTTTTAMLATTLAGAGARPSFVVGGVVEGLGAGGHWDQGEWLAVEADESDGTFLHLAAEVAVVTSVAPDHLDHWGSFAALVDAFARFSAAARVALVCADDDVAAGVGRTVGARSYGTAPGADYRVVGLELEPAASRFRLERHGVVLGEVGVPQPGRHNALNAAAALAAAMETGVAFADAAAALARFPGVARRFELRGQAGGVTVVDDYAHLPDKVAAAIAAARGGGWRRVVCVFQPHRYSRTEALWRDFATAFDGVDVLVVTDVYAAGEAPRAGVSGKLIVDAVAAARPAQAVAWLPRRADVLPFLRSRLRPGDLCLTVGAGDVTTLADDLLAALS